MEVLYVSELFFRIGIDLPSGVSAYSSGSVVVEVEILFVVELLGVQEVVVEAVVEVGRVVSLVIELVVNEGCISQGFVMGE